MEHSKYCQLLVGKALSSARKIDGCELYEMIFSNTTLQKENELTIKNSEMCLHILCPITKHDHQDGTYTHLNENTKNSFFNSIIAPYIGQIVEKVTLDRTNNLSIFIGGADFTTVTYDDCEESWRLFNMLPHLVGYKDKICWE